MAGIELTVNHHVGLQRFFCAFVLSTEFRDLVLQIETNVLTGGALVNTDSREKVLDALTNLEWISVSSLFLIGESSEPLSFKDRLPTRIFAIYEATRIVGCKPLQNID